MTDAAVALMQIMLINVVLSGDNAVVIALACRRLSPAHQKQAFVWGSVGVVVLMVGLTACVVFLLSLPYLEVVGSLLLLWIGIKLLVAEDEAEEGVVQQKSTLGAAIRTIIVADIIMSLDNVLAMAGAAKGHMWMLIAGLVVTVPVILFGSALLMKLMSRFPVFVTIGAGLMLRSVAALHQIDPGFPLDGAVTFELSLPSTRYGCRSIGPLRSATD
jgi:YjbE family integral membrane protein